MKVKMAALLALAVLAGQPATAWSATDKTNASKGKSASAVTEGPCQIGEIIVGPFDIHRRYRSMEGPYMSQRLAIGDLIESKSIALPESLVNFTETSNGQGPSMQGGGMKPTNVSRPPGLLDTSGQGRQLYWFKGMKIEVLDEHNKPLPTGEFICHLNLDIDNNFRNAAFPEGQQLRTTRLITLTQGQSSFFFPSGYGVPVASDEPWTLMFQAANRTTDEHRRLKHRCRLYFIKDSNLVYPIKALTWSVPFMTVVVDKDTAEAKETEHHNLPDCSGMSAGVTAPNAVPGSLSTDSLGRKVDGHWVVPPGTTTYTSPITDLYCPGFADKDRKIIAAWSHVHPMCAQASLVSCDGQKRTKIFSATVKTDAKKGLEIKHIDDVLSAQGILMPHGHHYELEATYVNNTGKPLDSMVTEGIFFADDTFARPAWVANGRNQSNQAFCGVSAPHLSVNNGQCAVVSPAPAATGTSLSPVGISSLPLFDTRTDGPLLTAPVEMELLTSAGKIHLMLDPSLAPVHASQMYRLFKAGAFNGTAICRYEPNYLLQLSNAEDKAPGQRAIPEQVRSLLRRLPLEVSAQKTHQVSHTRGVLSMARWDDNDSAVSSFSIMLADAAHLNDNYTIFGRLVPDDVTLQTISAIQRAWGQDHAYIISASEKSQQTAQNKP